jgi:glycosyltransferase involved in cell wall biosynthesis
MIAYRFPPLRGSSGIQRTLRFARYLPEFGWEPVIVTANPRAYPDVADDQLADVPTGIHVCRALAFDSARHFAIGRRYPAFLARPDRWMSWWLGAVPAGLRLIRRFAPDILWSTFPIATAHRIGATLQRLSRLPWVADFRDPMAQDGYPEDPCTWAWFKAIEERAAARAERLVFTTPSAQRMYRERYANVPSERFALIENGYDEESFAPMTDGRRPLNPGMLTLLHSGIVYPQARDPSAVIAALRDLVDRGVAGADRMRVRFRAPVHDAMLRELARDAGVTELVEILPPLDYADALAEMQRADALLVLQSANCNEQIPAKIYEYMRARRPILALTDRRGDTAAALRAAGFDAIAPLDDRAAIASLLARFIDAPDALPLPDEQTIARHSRRGRTAQLAGMLDALVDARRLIVSRA